MGRAAEWRLGSRVFWSGRIWATILLCTFFYCEGVGFASLAFPNHCHGGPLFYQPVFPPDVSVGTFLLNFADVWVFGMFRAGLGFMGLLIVLFLLAGSRMSGYALERVLSWPVILALTALAGPFGYFYAFHDIATTGAGPCLPWW